jgi:UDP-galactopyranose mutase
MGANIDAAALSREFSATPFDACVLTCPLDAFLGKEGALKWRGVELRSSYFECEEDETRTAAYVVNRPSLRVAYTRTVETKHASGQLVKGTVVSEEYPGSEARHYPVLTVDATNEAANQAFKEQISRELDVPVFFAGRLANYCYINQDQAIRQGMDVAQGVRQLR